MSPLDSEQRRDIRNMCGYIQDDEKIARHHQIPVEQVAIIRASMPYAKRRGKERTTFSHQASGASAGDVISTDRLRYMEAKESCDRMLLAMLKTGHHWLKLDPAVCSKNGWKAPARG